MTDDNHVSAVDLARTISLDDGPWQAAVCVDSDGTESLWLLSPDPVGVRGCACSECARHEQLTLDHRQTTR